LPDNIEKMDHLSKYLSSPKPDEIVVQSRYSYVDQLHLENSNVDIESALKNDIARKMVDILIERNLIEFKMINTTNPYEASVTISGKIKVQPPYLEFKLSGMI